MPTSSTERSFVSGPRPGAPSGTHVVQVYEDDAFLVESLARFVASGLAGGDAVLVIVTARHRVALDRRLTACGFDVGRARDERRYVTLDAGDTLSRIVIEGWPDESLFVDLVGGLIAELAKTHGARVRAFGEMVALLWAEGRTAAAIHLEDLWNGLGRRLSFELLCAYPLTVFDTSSDGVLFEQMCERHSGVIPAESYRVGTIDEGSLRLVAQLQQKAALAQVEAEARRQAEAALQRQQEELTDFVDHAALPIHFVGPDGTILRANRAELTMLGYEESEYVGHPIAKFHVDEPTIRAILHAHRMGETLRGYEARLRCRDGSIKAVLIDSNVTWRDGEFVHARCITRDVTALEQAEYVQRQLAALVESSDDAIVGKTLDGIVTSWNRGAERVFGYSAEEMVGQPIARLIPEERANDLAAILNAIRRGERVDHYETERVRKDGRRIHVSLTVSPIRDGTGRVVGASKIARDVTDRKLADAERERLFAVAECAREQAEAANRAKDEFLSVVSHELRTPLASILGWVGVLKNSPTPERAARAVETIERSGRMQAKIIDDLLDVSRIISGHMRLDLRLVDLSKIVSDALDTIRPTADAKGIKLDGHIETGAGPVAGDPERLHQVAWNLLSNAVKFTPTGGRVDVRLIRRRADVQLVIRDTGCGIPPEFVPFVFDRFRQAENVVTRRTGGIGLGLAIVRHLVELHGGDVDVDSAGEGRGATFTVTVPFSRVQDQASEARSDVLRSRQVVLVEDDPESRDALRAVLEAHGAHVVAVGSAEEARDEIQRRRPDVLVSDIGLPGADGYSLIRELRASPTLSTLPAIAVTGSRDQDAEGVAMMAGYQVRLLKPVDPDLLVTAAVQLTARSSAPR